MNEVMFLVEEAPEGGFTARALGASIFTKRTISQVYMHRSVTPSNAITTTSVRASET